MAVDTLSVTPLVRKLEVIVAPLAVNEAYGWRNAAGCEYWQVPLLVHNLDSIAGQAFV